MTIPITNLPTPTITCASCQACCCRLEVMLISDTGVPDRFIKTDQWGGEVMRRLDDGWCAALDRDTLLCTIYEVRPWVCREFAMGSQECISERLHGQ
ncbi:YkgJ family cysteine cluster protein [Pseudomonas sp. N040]|uniref:YkgJ family cysteine cluster protein n=1 Tax=Pseudomonas sp. N040 TaxID=2785325 RepID=UPI0018A33994|nr:YkgJ family cysteine cluster protein [Pseudomonas sp. N040]MBF7730455.1 YkgJ family cysteine cluster protein [Pseudomonas sp. N040]MBW7014098.1 YkgJ family cysteine cluster protein [Pseudomonas sp. N040]